MNFMGESKGFAYVGRMDQLLVVPVNRKPVNVPLMCALIGFTALAFLSLGLHPKPGPHLFAAQDQKSSDMRVATATLADPAPMELAMLTQ
ncbi:hypothetical protein FGG78_34335 [Thioclava sp. BHET1]|nr:hypothetical protein FGG78_34335 [Thioclava sp. BHET1]